MRASRVENTPWHSTRGRTPPLFHFLTQTPNRYPFLPSSEGPPKPRQLDIPPPPPSHGIPCKYSSFTLSGFLSNSDPNQYTPTPFNNSEGYIMRMFGRRDAVFFIESLLKMDAREVNLVRNVPGWNNALMSTMPSIRDARYAAVTPSNQPLWLLDFIPMPMFHVVPQQIWAPPNQSDWRRYVEQASLRMPVFFIQNNGAIGLPLAQALNGDRALLRGANTPAPLGGGHSTQIRIAVSRASLFPPLSLPSPNFPPFPPSPSSLRLSFWLKYMIASQWPGYEMWERQIQIRDQTRQRNEITLERFVKLVAGVVDRFLTVGLSCSWPVWDVR